MSRLSADDQRVSAAAGQRLAQSPGRIETFAPLVESRHLHIDAKPNLPQSGASIPLRTLMSVVLPVPLGRRSDPVARMDPNREIVDNRRAPKALPMRPPRSPARRISPPARHR